MLIFSLTLIYFFIAIQDGDSHVLRSKDQTAVKRTRNLDIPALIDPVQQSSATGGESIDDQLRRTKSVFSVPVRPSTGSVSDCPQGTRRVVENGPCLTETPMIKTSGDKFLVDSLRKFYSPNSHHTRPHHRKRKPTSTTSRPIDFVASYVTGDIGHDSNKPGDDTLTISGAGIISPATNEFPITEIIMTTSVKSVTQSADEVETQMPTTTTTLAPTTALVEPEDLSELNVQLLFEATTQPMDPVIETTVKYYEPIEVTADIVYDNNSNDKAVSNVSLITTTEVGPAEIATEPPTLLQIVTSVNETSSTVTSVVSPTATTTTSEPDPEPQTSTLMAVTTGNFEPGRLQPELEQTTVIEFIETTPVTSAPESETPTTTSSPALLSKNIEVDPVDFSTSPSRVPAPAYLPDNWAEPQRPYHHTPFYHSTLRPSPAQIDIRNPSSSRPYYYNRNFKRQNIYQNDHFSLDYVNMNGHHPRAGFRSN